MRTINTKVLSLIAVFVFASTAFSAVTIDFEGLGAERDQLTSMVVNDSDTGYSTTVEFWVFENAAAPLNARPILVEEGGIGIANTIVGFEPNDTPDGEVLGNGNDWMLGNGQGIGENFMFRFVGRPVADVSIEVIDFRGDGPFSAGTPGSDRITLRTFDGMGNQFLPDSWVVPNPRPVDGVVTVLSSAANGVYEARVVQTPYAVDVGVAVDNLTFTVIPEPGSGSLLCIALMFVAGIIRRK